MPSKSISIIGCSNISVEMTCMRASVDHFLPFYKVNLKLIKINLTRKSYCSLPQVATLLWRVIRQIYWTTSAGECSRQCHQIVFPVHLCPTTAWSFCTVPLHWPPPSSAAFQIAADSALDSYDVDETRRIGIRLNRLGRLPKRLAVWPWWPWKNWERQRDCI